jgi:hypothetical protein
MNREFVKKNKVPPPRKMGKITQAQWEEFVRQKTELKAKELGETNSQRAKMNKHPHRLGSTGYHHKVVQWNRIVEEAIANDTLDPILKDIDERAIRWMNMCMMELDMWMNMCMELDMWMNMWNMCLNLCLNLLLIMYMNLESKYESGICILKYSQTYI